MKKEHKFFERFLENDLDSLYTYLESKQLEILSGKIGNIPESTLSKYNVYNGPTTQLGMFYNVLTLITQELKPSKKPSKRPYRRLQNTMVLTLRKCNIKYMDGTT